MSDYKSKKAALEKAAWMNQKPNPIPVFPRGKIVAVYRGAGWSKGKVVNSTNKSCVVKLFQGDIMVNVYDARCVKPVDQSVDEDLS